MVQDVYGHAQPTARCEEEQEDDQADHPIRALAFIRSETSSSQAKHAQLHIWLKKQGGR